MTRRLPADYAGDDPGRCNARTPLGKPCGSRALPNGRCKWHGGLSTGPRTTEGRAKALSNLKRGKIGNHRAHGACANDFGDGA